MSPKPTFRPYIFSTIFLILLGWGGLYLITFYTLPFIWPRWGFFALWLTALTATAFPIIYFVTTRFSTEKLEPQVMVRRALWVGVYGATLAWLQLARLVNVYVILGLAFGLIAIESLLRLRERARWRVPEVPEAEQHDQSA
ncbi:MAG: hypothetical protein ACOYZ6_11550 [Chloroflexota bacterium]